jgi:hypothetical protein
MPYDFASPTAGYPDPVDPSFAAATNATAKVSTNAEEVAGGKVRDRFVAVPGFEAVRVVVDQPGSATLEMFRVATLYTIGFLNPLPAAVSNAGARVEFTLDNSTAPARIARLLDWPEDLGGIGLWTATAQRISS